MAKQTHIIIIDLLYRLLAKTYTYQRKFILYFFSFFSYSDHFFKTLAYERKVHVFEAFYEVESHKWFYWYANNQENRIPWKQKLRPLLWIYSSLFSQSISNLRIRLDCINKLMLPPHLILLRQIHCNISDKAYLS